MKSFSRGSLFFLLVTVIAMAANAGIISPGSFGKITTQAKSSADINCKTDVYDNDEIVAVCKARGEYRPRHDIGSQRNFFSYEEVMQAFSPYLEAQFDTFIIANTAEKDSRVKGPEYLVRPQSLLVLRKKPGFEQIFLRNSRGMVVGIDFNRVEEDLNGVPNQIKTSSGKKGDGGILTFSGVFTVHRDKSKRPSRSWSAAMSHSIYLAYRYGNNGRWTGVAMHGTPERRWDDLGERASHGCLRIHPQWAERLWAMIIPEKTNGRIPKFDFNKPFPTLDIQNWEGSNRVRTRFGPKTLFIIFNGHGQHESKGPYRDRRGTGIEI